MPGAIIGPEEAGDCSHDEVLRAAEMSGAFDDDTSGISPEARGLLFRAALNCVVAKRGARPNEIYDQGDQDGGEG
jgi:hypothetical protein